MKLPGKQMYGPNTISDAAPPIFSKRPYPGLTREYLVCPVEELRTVFEEVWNECAERCTQYFNDNGVKCTVTPPFDDYWNQEGGGL
jgi:hypothetical protein